MAFFQKVGLYRVLSVYGFLSGRRPDLENFEDLIVVLKYLYVVLKYLYVVFAFFSEKVGLYVVWSV